MDQDRPHEAPRSEVRETLDDWRAAWNRVGTPLMIGLTAVLITYAAWNFFLVSRSSAYNEAWSALAASTSPASFRGVAADTSDAAVRQNARLTAADLLLDEAVRAPYDDAAGASDAVEQPDPLQQAQVLYQQVLDEADAARSGAAGHVLYRLNALEGLAVVAQARRDPETARIGFEKVIALADATPGLNRWSARARGHIEALPLLDRTPVYAPEPAPAPTPDAAASVEPADGTASVPATSVLDTPAAAVEQAMDPPQRPELPASEPQDALPAAPSP